MMAKLKDGLSPPTVVYMGNTLRTPLNRAIKWGLLYRNVAALADRRGLAARRSSRWRQRRSTFFLAGIEADSYGPLFTVALTTHEQLFAGSRWHASGLVFNEFDRDTAGTSLRAPPVSGAAATLGDWETPLIAGIFNRQGRLRARGKRFTAVKVQGLRHHRGIPRYESHGSNQTGDEVLLIARAVQVFGIGPNPPSLDRDGFIAREQPTPGAPWYVRVSDDLKSQFVEEAPPGWVTMWEAMRALGVSRQTVLQRVKPRWAAGPAATSC
jgi:hypothetical protein